MTVFVWFCVTMVIVYTLALIGWGISSLQDPKEKK